MPTIDTIDSIKIKIYSREYRPPHFHAEYNEYEVLIEIETCKIYAGSMLNKQFAEIIKYAKENQT